MANPILSRVLAKSRVALHYLYGSCQIVVLESRSMPIVRQAEPANQLQARGFILGDSSFGGFDTLGGPDSAFIAQDGLFRTVRSPGGVADTSSIRDLVFTSQKQVKISETFKASDAVSSRVVTIKRVVVVDTLVPIETVTAVHTP